MSLFIIEHNHNIAILGLVPLFPCLIQANHPETPVQIGIDLNPLNPGRERKRRRKETPGCRIVQINKNGKKKPIEKDCKTPTLISTMPDSCTIPMMTTKEEKKLVNRKSVNRDALDDQGNPMLSSSRSSERR